MKVKTMGRELPKWRGARPEPERIQIRADRVLWKWPAEWIKFFQVEVIKPGVPLKEVLYPSGK